ncbi:MAG: hypothetical protein TEF_11125 [Rhizobiales bacterium NRL2]|jgi:hypothetical protein|nr:MAG: hypothetical protein TEF_11125 [Rhizobiales bacterium NRL2]
MDTQAPLSVPDAREPERPRWTSITYDGERKAFRRLLMREAPLIAATGGIYWFWARTRVRRFIWAHTKINGTPLEYSGRGLELFLGFVIAGALFALTYWLLQLAVLSAGFGPLEGTVVSLGVYALFFTFLYALAAYRTRRYMVRRTSWRGIRCGLEGSSLGFVRHALPAALATVFTLGLAFPWLNVVVQRYLIENMSLGSARFHYDGRGRELFRPWLAVWLLLLPTAGYALVWWRGRAMRYHYNATRMNGLALNSSLDPWKIVVISIIGGLLIGLLFYLPAGLVFAAAGAATTAVGNLAAIAVAGVIAFSVFFAAAWAILLYFVEYRITEHALQALLISGSMDWNDIEQVHPQAAGPGDGLDAVLSMDGI